MEECVLKGTLSYFAKGTISRRWETKFCVLYATSPKQIGRLDWFKGGEDDYERYPKTRRTVYVEEIISVLQSKCTDSQLFAFEIHARNCKAPLTFAANSEEERSKWMRALEEARCSSCLASHCTNNDTAEGLNMEYQNENSHLPVDPGSVFEVAVNDTDLSKRLNIHGKYLLQLTHISVQLMQLDDVNAQGPLFTWPYRLIRRWGRNKNYFTFEAGSKCTSGEGLLSFTTMCADAIFKRVQEYTKHSNVQHRTSSSNINGNQVHGQVKDDGSQVASISSQPSHMIDMASESQNQTAGMSKNSKLSSHKNHLDELRSNTHMSSSLYCDSTSANQNSTTYSEPYFFVKEKAARIAASPFAAAGVVGEDDNTKKAPPARSRMAEIAMELQAQGPVKVGESSEYATLSLVEGINKTTVVSAEHVEGDYGIVVSKNEKKNKKSFKS